MPIADIGSGRAPYHHATIWSWVGVPSAHRFDLAQPPLFREERFERAVEAKQREPALAGHGLNPVAPLHSGRLRRTEVDRGGAVCVRFGGGRRIALATGPRIALRGIEH